MLGQSTAGFDGPLANARPQKCRWLLREKALLASKLSARDQTQGRCRLLLLCFVLSLATYATALGQDFRPTMVETGLVNTDSHITFDPPFPHPPTVVLSVSRVLDATAGCSPTVKNVTSTGFDYASNCTAGFKYPSTWIATLQQK